MSYSKFRPCRTFLKHIWVSDLVVKRYETIALFHNYNVRHCREKCNLTKITDQISCHCASGGKTSSYKTWVNWVKIYKFTYLAVQAQHWGFQKHLADTWNINLLFFHKNLLFQSFYVMIFRSLHFYIQTGNDKLQYKT